MKQLGCQQIARRGRVWSVIALLLFLALGARLWSIQIVHHAHYDGQAKSRRGRRWPIHAPRGNIYDREGTPLALNLKLFSVAADPGLIAHSSELAAQLAPLLRMPKQRLEDKLAAEEGVRYVRLRESVDTPTAEAVRGLGHHGLIVDTQWRRAYPHRKLAAPVVGFTGRDRIGLSGVERALNEHLAGIDGEMMVVLDGRLPRSRDQIPGRTVVTKQMIPGSSVFLTIDLNIQAIVEDELAKAITTSKAVGGTAIVMNPINGEVLALATHPSFDPNEFWRYPEHTWVSPAVASPFEPGSTFKLITACAAIEEAISRQTYQCTGSRAVGRHRIKCPVHEGKRDHGHVDLDHMVIRSCNTGIATVALALGPKRMYYWARRFGFGEKTGFELAGESRGILPPPDTWSQIRVATTGFGQGVSVTPLQLLAAYCTVASGGWRVHPRLVKAIADPTGRIESPPRPKTERILSAATCEHMRAVLEKAVEEGTGQQARIPGRRVAGKTGTAQKPTRKQGFLSGKYVASFAGFAPADHPRLAVLVVIDEPQNGHYGGAVAAPVFRAICERSLTYLRVPPDAPAPGLNLALAGREG